MTVRPGLKAGVHTILHRLGFDLVRFPGNRTPLGRRIRLFRTFGINLVLDVGANVGQYALELRDIGYSGRIVSFEPLPVPFQILEERARKDPNWTAANFALGDADGRATLHVSENSVSSSLLDMLPAHAHSAPASRYVEDVSVDVRRLDSVAAEFMRMTDRTYLKIDVQGFERRVLAGADELLPDLVGLQIELALEPLYAGGELLPEMIEYVGRHGFRLMGIEPGFTDTVTGILLQADGLFFRPDAGTRGRQSAQEG